MRKKNMILVLVLVLVLGFASVSATLVLNGTVGISSKQSDFDIIFTNAILDGVERKDFIKGEQLIQFETETITELDVPTTLEYEVTNKSRIYDAEVNIVCNIVDNEGNVTTNNYISIRNTPDEMTVRAGVSGTGRITATLIKASTEEQDIKIKCTLNASATERESLGAEYKKPIVMPSGVELIADANNSGTLDVGDEIAIEEEHFYVISNENGKINALAKYNLMVGNEVDSSTNNATPLTNPTGIQDPRAKGYVEGDANYYGSVAFSDTYGWPYGNNVTIDIRNDSHADGPVKDALYGTNGYESYIKQTIPTATVRLITKKEIETLVNDGENLSAEYINEKADAKNNSWIYSTSYWTQSTYYNHGAYAWYVCSDGEFDFSIYYSDTPYGVRPVVEISLS